MSARQLSQKAQRRVLGKQRVRAEREAHYYWHLLLVSAPPILLVPVVGWMVWRLSLEGLYAAGLIVVTPVLAALMIVAARCMIIIALEGLKEGTRTPDIKATRAHREAVSVQKWQVQPGQAISALQRAKQPPRGKVLRNSVYL